MAGGSLTLHLELEAADDVSLLATLESAEDAALEVRQEASALRIGTFLSVGEDYRTVTEIVTLLDQPATRALWSGLGNRVVSEMDVCLIASSRFPDARSLERTFTSSAQFTARRLDAALLSRLKKGCLPLRPTKRSERLLFRMHE